MLIGQDLAFTRGRRYAEGSLYADLGVEQEEDGSVFFTNLKVKGDLFGRETPDREFAPGTLRLEGWYGDEVLTDRSYASFREEYRAVGETLASEGVRVFNCTEGGARIPGLGHQAFASLLQQLAGPTLPVEEKLAAAVVASASADSNGLAPAAREMVHAARRLQAEAARGREKLVRFERAQGTAAAGSLLRAAQKAERKVHKHLARLPVVVEFLTQNELHDLQLASRKSDHELRGAIELATAGIDLGGSIGSLLGVNIEAPNVIVVEDPIGLTIGADARITASMPAPGAPDLLASYHVDEVFPVFPATTPIGGLPYGLGFCLGTSAFNQLLKAEVESGLLALTITELDFGTGPIPITAGLLSAFIPELSQVDPTEPYELVLEPGAAPFVTGAPGPAGELALMHVPHLLLTMQSAIHQVPMVVVVIDAQVGLDFAFAAGELAVTIGSVAPGSIQIDIVENLIGTNETVLAAVLEVALDSALLSLTDSFASFPIPDLLGLTITFLEASRNGEFISFWLDVN